MSYSFSVYSALRPFAQQFDASFPVYDQSEHAISALREYIQALPLNIRDDCKCYIRRHDQEGHIVSSDYFPLPSSYVFDVSRCL